MSTDCDYSWLCLHWKPIWIYDYSDSHQKHWTYDIHLYLHTESIGLMILAFIPDTGNLWLHTGAVASFDWLILWWISICSIALHRGWPGTHVQLWTGHGAVVPWWGWQLILCRSCVSAPGPWPRAWPSVCKSPFTWDRRLGHVCHFGCGRFDAGPLLVQQWTLRVQ